MKYSKTERSKQIVNAHLKTAKAYSELSYAKRLKVGAVLVKKDRVVSVGRNGTPPGWDNICEFQSFNESGEPILITKPEVIHAEANAILFAAREGIKTEGCEMVTTDSPCFECAKLIVNSGIKVVYYNIEYRDKSGIKFLKENKIVVKKIT